MADTDRTIPKSARVLGWLGVLPFAGLGGAVLTGLAMPKPLALDALTLYAMVILAFMGGVRWGLAMVAQSRRTSSPDRIALIVSVVPALLGFTCWFLPRTAGLLGFMFGFSGLLVYDLLTSQGFGAPVWYLRLRIQLTTAVLICLGAAVAYQ